MLQNVNATKAWLPQLVSDPCALGGGPGVQTPPSDLVLFCVHLHFVTKCNISFDRILQNVIATKEWLHFVTKCNTSRKLLHNVTKCNCHTSVITFCYIM